MADLRQATHRGPKKIDSFTNWWNRFVSWSRASGRQSLPASPEDVVAYLEDSSRSGGKPSTLQVVAFAIDRNHRDAGFDIAIHQGVAWTMLDELIQEDPPAGP